jgi:hypothetical protein
MQDGNKEWQDDRDKEWHDGRGGSGQGVARWKPRNLGSRKYSLAEYSGEYLPENATPVRSTVSTIQSRGSSSMSSGYDFLRSQLFFITFFFAQ